MKGQEHNFRAQTGTELGYNLEPIKDRQRYINYEYIGVKAQHFHNGIPSVVYCANNVEVPVQQCPYSCQDRFMVVRKQYPNLAFAFPAGFR